MSEGTSAQSQPPVIGLPWVAGPARGGAPLPIYEDLLVASEVYSEDAQTKVRTWEWDYETAVVVEYEDGLRLEDPYNTGERRATTPEEVSFFVRLADLAPRQAGEGFTDEAGFPPA